MNRYHVNSARTVVVLSLLLMIIIGLSVTQGAAQSFEDQLPLYLVRFAEEPVATYMGDIASLAATSIEVTGEKKLDASSKTSLAYHVYLAKKQVSYIRSMEQQLGRPLNVAYQYFYANNGLALHLTADEAAQVAKMAGVVSVKKDEERALTTDNGPVWIGAPEIWDGSGTGGLGSTQGEGMIVGIIDTGINPSNPSFASVGPVDGYVHVNPYGSGNYTPGSYCDTVDSTFCNDKLIGAWGYLTVNGGDPTDTNGHGSHTASTAAGNVVTAIVSAPTTSVTRTISGVAPHANIIAYAACCTLSALTAAIDQVVVDQVDVVNYSIGSLGCAPSDTWNDFDTIGFLNARNAGIFVATSAGNCGPGVQTVGSPADAPWLTSVAASTHDRVFFNLLADMSGGNTPPPDDIAGRGLTSAYGPAPIVYAGDYGDALCANPFAAGTWTNGEIVVCDRGSAGRIEKGQNVLAGGAGGYVLANTAADGNSLVTDAHVLPAVHIAFNDGLGLKNWLASGSGHMATISGWSVAESPAIGDVMASFSSRGANQVIDILSPSVAAPGVDILAAAGTSDNAVWDLISGTSMASPHVAGSAALLMALHSGWTPAEVQSALMTTAETSLLDSNGVSPAGPFDYGSGRVDLSLAAQAGLVLDETGANYLAADPSGGGDPKTLNLASMQNSNCQGTCTWKRTVTSTQSTAVDWTASANTPAGMNVSISPSNFTLPPGGSQTLDITADINGLPAENWAFAEVLLAATDQPTAVLPIAVIPQPGVPIIDVEPDNLDVAQQPDTVMTYKLDIDNVGSADLAWSIGEANDPAPGFSPEAHPWRGISSTIEGGFGLSNVAGTVSNVALQAPNAFTKVIWDQPTSGPYGGVSDYWNNQNKGAYSANDFILGQPETISLIFVDGFDNDNKLANQSAITWMIYSDAGGAPAGHPEDGGGTELWSYSAAPGDSGVDITNNAISLDLVAASQPLVSLPSGTYWLAVYPTYNNPQWRWNWYMASPLGNTAQFIDPTDIFGLGFTSWTPWTSADNNIVDLAFRLEGPSVCNQPSDIPWVSVSPTSGLTGPAGSFPVDVTFDSTGLQIGTYTGTMCVNSNDPSNPVIEIPLSLTVTDSPDLQIDKDDGGLTVAPGDTLTYTLTFTNTGIKGATGVVLTDTVPANTTFNPGASTAGWSCAPDNSAGSTCTFNFGTVSVGGGGSAGFVVTVDSPIPPLVSTIDNTAEIGDDGSHGPDANLDDNLDSVMTQLNGRVLLPFIMK